MPPQQSQLLCDALAPAIGTDNVTLTLLEGASSHGGAQFSDAANMQLVLEFLAANLN